MFSKRWLAVLVAGLVGEIAFSIFGSADELGSTLAGHGDLRDLAAVVALACLIPVLIASGFLLITIARSRRELFKGRQVLAAVAATSADWLWEADTEHRLTYCSRGVTDLLGHDPGALLGRSALTLMPETATDSAEALMRQALAAGDGWDGVEGTWRHADGSDVLLVGNAAAIRDENGAVVGFRGSRRRVTPAEIADRVRAAARGRVDRVLTGKGLTIALQPIVDLSTGRLVGAEALARFTDGRGPDLWFRDAADAGLSLELDRLAFSTALELFGELPDNCYLSVNATPDLVLSGIAEVELLSRELPLDRLVLEITEHAQVASYRDLQTALLPLRDRGVRVAIDDTGAGYASLSHVLQLQPSIIKLDRSLITDVAADPARRSLITALVLLALDLDASITGEGIETASELNTLHLLGVDCGQGFLLARPSTQPTDWQNWADRTWSTEPGTVDAEPAPPSTKHGSKAGTAA